MEQLAATTTAAPTTATWGFDNGVPWILLPDGTLQWFFSVPYGKNKED